MSIVDKYMTFLNHNLIIDVHSNVHVCVCVCVCVCVSLFFITVIVEN